MSIEIPNKPDDFRLWAHIEELITHLRGMLISLHFFVRWELFSFLTPLTLNLTKIDYNIVLLEEDSLSSFQ